MATATLNSWNALYTSGYMGSDYPDSHVIRFVAKHFYAAPNRSRVRIADIGCGSGATVWYLAREGFEATGCDGSEHAVKRANERLRADRLPGYVWQASLTALPWGNETLDVVIDNCALTHNAPRDIYPILMEVHRVLRPGGRFFSVVFGCRTWARAVLDKQPVELFVDDNIRLIWEQGGKSRRYGESRPGLFRIEALNMLEWTDGDDWSRVQLWLVEAVK